VKVSGEPARFDSDMSAQGTGEVVELLPTDGASKWLLQPGCVSVEGRSWNVPARYEIGEMLGSGAYGAVCEAWDAQEQRKVAIKRVDGVYQDSVTSKRILREVAILSHLRHRHIVQIFDLPPLDQCEVLYIVMELCDTDLRKVCMNSRGVSLAQARKLTHGLLVGCSYLHSAGIYHRDLKPANCLVNRDCSVKIGDFNLSISVQPTSLNGAVSVAGGGGGGGLDNPQDDPGDRLRLRRTLTTHVASRWYRPPEVILRLGYTEAMDVWSAGCIIAELFCALNEDGRRPKRGALFPGDRDPWLSAASNESTDLEMAHAGDQLSVIFDILGTPSEAQLEALAHHDVDVVSYLGSYPTRLGRRLRMRLPPEASEEGLDLLEQMLCLLPGERISMATAVRHPFLDAVRGFPSGCAGNGCSVAPWACGDPEEWPHPTPVDIGLDEDELDRTASVISWHLQSHIQNFKSPPSPSQLLPRPSAGTVDRNGAGRRW